MVTVSTLPRTDAGSPRRGFRLFVDGRLAAELTSDDAGDALASPGDHASPGDSLTGDAVSPGGPPVTGGDPMDMSQGHLVLCGRSDRDPQRYYSGLLSNLALFSQVCLCVCVMSVCACFCSCTFAAAGWIDPLCVQRLPSLGCIARAFPTSAAAAGRVPGRRPLR